MRRKVYNILFWLVFLNFPIGLFGVINSKVSYRYEVDHMRTIIQIEQQNISDKNYKTKVNEINEKEKKINSFIHNSKTQAMVGLLLGILILIFKKKIIKY